MSSAPRRQYYGIAEIADALGVDRQLVTVWRRRLSRGMPPPDEELAAGPLWTAPSIEPWIEHTRARMARERSDAGPPPPELIRQTSRRLLRLAAVLLEEAPEPSQVDRGLLALAQLGDTLSAHAGDGDPLRRLCGDLATLAGAARAASPVQPARSAAVLAGLRAECLRLLPGVAKHLGASATDDGAAATRH
jgi:transposase-like protein